MDGKKRRNKKKKAGQSKAAEDIANNSEEVVTQDHDHGSGPEQNHRALSSSNADLQSVGVSESDMETERQKAYEGKFAMLQEEVRRLEDERNMWLQREAGLEEKIKHMQNEVDSCLQHEAKLEEKLNNLQIRNDSLIEKEAILENKVKHIEDIKDSWNLNEISIKEMIARMEEVNRGHQMQVKGLEESRNDLVQENLKLMQRISALESRTENLEKEASFNRSSAVMTEKLSEEKSSLHYMEEAIAPMEKQDAKNSEPVGKVNELYNEPEGQVTTSVYRSTTELSHVMTPVRTAMPTDYASEHGKKEYDSSEKFPPLVSNHGIYGVTNGVEDFVAADRLPSGQQLQLDESRVSEEIVQIPLDDIQVQEADPQVTKNDESSGVPLSDAPLIGAPFRLVSFVAKYVSGSDLVNQSNSKLAQ